MNYKYGGLNLDSFLYQENKEKIRKGILEVQKPSKFPKNVFNYKISEGHCTCDFQYKISRDLKEIVIDLKIVQVKSDLQNNTLTLDFTQDYFSWIPVKEGFSFSIEVSIERIGWHHAVGGIHIKSDGKIVVNTIIKGARLSTIDFSGSFNNISIEDVNVGSLKFGGKYSKIEIGKICPVSSNSNGKLTLTKVTSSIIKLKDIKNYKSIEVDDGKFESINLYDCNSESFSMIAAVVEQLHLKECTIESVKLSSLWSLNGYLSFVRNIFGVVQFRNLKFKERRFKSLAKLMRVKFEDLKHNFSILFEDNATNSLKLQNVQWAYDSILSETDSEYKREFILKIKQFYGSIQDVTNEKLFKSFEKIWYYENRNLSFPLFLSYKSNKFGLSIGKPILFLLIFIALQFGIFYYAASSECQQIILDKWSTFSHLLNPAHRTSIFINTLENCNVSSEYFNVITVVDNIFRLIIGYLIFQFIDAFRYKYNLGR